MFVFNSVSLTVLRLTISFLYQTHFQNRAFPGISRNPIKGTHKFRLIYSTITSKNSPVWKRTHFIFCVRNDVFNDCSSTQLPEKAQGDNNRIRENAELRLLIKPSPKPITNHIASEIDEESEKTDREDALSPFLKFFKAKDSSRMNQLRLKLRNGMQEAFLQELRV